MILITGSTGYIGQHLVRRLVAQGERPRCLVRDPQKATRLFPAGGIEIVRGDTTNPTSLAEATKGVETIVHAAFYRANADYYQAKTDFGAYYKNALLYLACIDIKSLNPTERRNRAWSLSLAALVSPTIYNFGELVRFLSPSDSQFDLTHTIVAVAHASYPLLP